MKGMLLKQTLPRTFSIMLLVLPLLFIQCKQEYKLDLSLAVNSNEIHLEPQEGVTHIMVYANGSWDAHFTEEVDWVGVDKLKGEGNSDLKFSYSQNFGAARSVTLVLTKGSERQEVKIIQKGLDLAVRFAKNKFTLPKHALPTVLPIVNTLQADLKTFEVEYLYDDETSEQWVTDVVLTNEGLEFNALENNAGRNRAVRIYLTLTDAFDNEYLSFADVEQTVDVATLEQKYRTSSQLTKGAKLDTVVLKGNMGVHFPLFESVVTYEQGSNWIEDISLKNDSLLVLAVRENESGMDRNAQVQLRLTIDGTNLIQFTHHVFQSKEDFALVTFEEVRGMIKAASGTTIISAQLRALEGIVVSDEGNPNMETNPNTAFNRLDLTETYRTAYIQSLDGKYGFRLKFVNAGENTLKRFSKVRISVDGMTLEKDAAPTRYTIHGVRASDVVWEEAGSELDLPNKIKTIEQLTDEDIYTQVTLSAVNIAVPYGGYMNTNGGYLTRTSWNSAGILNGGYTDAIPTRIFDKQGSAMNILVNASAPWARNTLPKGTGTISGVIVHDKLKRFGGGDGDIGRYAIRPIDVNSIALDNQGQVHTLVEWNWIANGQSLCVATSASDIKKDAEGNILPAVGIGTLHATVEGANFGMGAHPICNTNLAHNGVHSSAFQYTGVKWWNAAENKGEGFVFNFSSKNITAQGLMMNFTIGGGSGSDASNHIPTYWQVEYSLDGINYNVLPNSTFAVRPLTQWGADRPFQSPGLISYAFKLPNTLLNKEDVSVRLVAKSNVYTTASGNEDGEITANMGGTSMRIGVVSFKYIQ